MSGELLWYVSRATGVVSLALLTIVLALGTLVAGRRSPQGSGATTVMAVHRWLSLGMSVFLVAHIVTAIADGYVDIGWLATVVPFTSGYETLWVGLGTIAVDLLLALIVTSLLRHRIAERTWRFVHWFAYAMWPVAVVHGFAMSTANQPLLRAATIVCGAVGLAAATWRLLTTPADRAQRRAVAAQEWA